MDKCVSRGGSCISPSVRPRVFATRERREMDMTAGIENGSRTRGRLLVFAQCLIAAAFVIRCNSMWITLETTQDLSKKIAYAMIFIGIGLSFYATRALKNTRKLVLGAAFAGMLAAYLIIFLFITDFGHKIFLRDAIVLLALVLYYFLVEDIQEVPGLLLRYEEVVTVVAVFSVICWLVFSVFRLLPPSGEAMTWWNGTDHFTGVDSFYGVYFEPQRGQIFGLIMIRNCGFFTEGPMASLHFSIALLINLFLRKKTSWIRVVLQLIAIGSTMSATGYVVAAIALVCKVLLILFRSVRFRQLKKAARTGIKIGIAILVLGVLAVCVFLVLARADSVSWLIRVEDMTAAIKAWLDKPLTGNGIYNFDAVKAHFPGSRATYAGFSCTTALGTILADGGLLFGFLYLGAFIYAIVKAIRNKEPELLIFAVLILIIFTMTIVPYDYIILFLFLFMAVYKNGLYRYLEQRI